MRRMVEFLERRKENFLSSSPLIHSHIASLKHLVFFSVEILEKTGSYGGKS